VIAYLNGHNHAGNYAERDGIHYVNFHGMVDTPDSSAFAVVEIAGDRLEIRGFGGKAARAGEAVSDARTAARKRMEDAPSRRSRASSGSLDCFRTERAIRAFGNSGCKYDELADVPLPARQRPASSIDDASAAPSLRGEAGARRNGERLQRSQRAQPFSRS
jgi:hypothetical protein